MLTRAALERETKERELLIASFPTLKTKARVQSFAFESAFTDQYLTIEIQTLQQSLHDEAALFISNPALLPFDASTEKKIFETIEESLIKKPKNLVTFFCCRDFYSVNLSTLSLVLLTMSAYPLKSSPSASLRS